MSTVVVVMGVSGSGKTTVGRALAERLGVPYAEADDFHSRSNIDKMTAGTALTDEDRWPWLRAIARWIGERTAAGGGVVTCSALKRPYRDLLRSASEEVWFLHLDGTPALIATRIAARTGHFMPPALLDSQFADLAPLAEDEPGLVLDVAAPAGDLVESALRAMPAPPPAPGSSSAR
ncbi:MAG: gluconokinase [Labedaea sp.]